MTTIDAGPVRGATVRPLIVLPSDPFGDQIGGIKTFVLDFVRFSPADFATEMVACSSDPAARPLGMWQTIEVAGRSVRYLPILATPDVHRRPIVPRSLWFAARTMFHRNARHTRGKVLQFHHPGSPAGYLTTSAPKILVVHLNAADIDRGLGESRWTTFPGMLHRYEDVTLPRIDRIFTVNEAGARFYRERHPAIADRVTYLPTFVDPMPSRRTPSPFDGPPGGRCWSGSGAQPMATIAWSCPSADWSARRIPCCSSRPLPSRRRGTLDCDSSWSARAGCARTPSVGLANSASPTSSTGWASRRTTRCAT